MPQDSVTINFQTDAQMRADLHAAAQLQERSVSALIRIAIRTMLANQPSQSAAVQQHGERGTGTV
jgi:hypothetical protein